MTDKELLEFAARAAGYALDEDGDRLDERGPSGAPLPWNPLVDDGDALRLAVKLSLTIEFDSMPDGSIVGVNAPFCDYFGGYKYEWNEWLLNDAHKATRRAIVRAAAEIGKESAARNIAAAGVVAPAV